MPADFEKQSYWHERFASESAFEWLVPSDRFMQVLDRYLKPLPKSSEILQLGFGTSDLQNHLRARGFENVTNVDYEPRAIERGRDCEKEMFGDVRMRYVAADVTQMDLQPETRSKFDLVIDKSTVDAVSCGGEDAVDKMARQVRQCMAGEAAWVSLSYSGSRFDSACLPFMARVVDKIPTPKAKPTDPDIFYFCYELRHPDDSADSAAPKV